MAGEIYTSKQLVKINGVDLSDDVAGHIRETVIDDRLQLPAYMTITFDDIPNTILDESGAKIGAKIEFSTSPIDESTAVKLFEGEITSLEGSYSQFGAQVVVRAYDLLHRLQAGRHTLAYQDVSDSDIVKAVAARNGVPIGQIDPTSTTYKHVAQANVSDWDFLKARARAAGCEMAMVDGRLNFRKPVKAGEAPPAGNLSSDNPKALVFSGELLEFHPRVTGGGQVPSVIVRSWDPKAKKEIEETSDTLAISVKVSDTPGAIASQLSEKDKYSSVSVPVGDEAGATSLASAMAEELGSAFFEADGIAIGDPRLKAGSAVSVSGVATKFAGSQVLSHVRHVFDEVEGYRTHFEISGRQERSLLGLASLGQTNGQVNQTGQPIYGVVPAIVTNINDDQDKDLRVKVRFPWLSPKSGEGSYESTWARIATPGAGPATGVLWMPEVDDEVLVGFEHGDIHRPYILGGLYNGQDKPNLELEKKGGDAGDLVQSGKAKRRGMVSRKGHRFVFVDDDQTSQIAISTSDGKLKIEWDEKKGELRITGDTKVIVSAKQELNLLSDKDINIKAQSNIKIEGSGNVNLEGKGQVGLKSSASFKVEGATVDVKGQGPVSVSGAMVKLG
jgi:phage protein D/phage baseplate assembly protein gpV